APELLALAKRAEGAQQGRILIVCREPALSLLELMRWISQSAFAVKLDQVGVPRTVEAARKDICRLAVTAQLQKTERGSARDLRLRARRLGQAIPRIAQAGGVVGKGAQLLALRSDPKLLALRSVEHPAPNQLLDQRWNVSVAARCLRCAKFEAERRRMQTRFASQRLQDSQCFLRLAL